MSFQIGWTIAGGGGTGNGFPNRLRRPTWSRVVVLQGIRCRLQGPNLVNPQEDATQIDSSRADTLQGAQVLLCSKSKTYYVNYALVHASSDTNTTAVPLPRRSTTVPLPQPRCSTTTPPPQPRHLTTAPPPQLRRSTTAPARHSPVVAPQDPATAHPPRSPNNVRKTPPPPTHRHAVPIRQARPTTPTPTHRHVPPIRATWHIFN
ncbi:hypothetical protein EDB84DRAFT_1441810 [Lactarius hengduanensis]|nr:hypothetical protein EDB84DRAFT_1441810 [Lactarius hengduanensis]